MKIRRLFTGFLACVMLLTSIPVASYATTSGNTGGSAGSAGHGGGGLN